MQYFQNSIVLTTEQFSTSPQSILKDFCHRDLEGVHDWVLTFIYGAHTVLSQYLQVFLSLCRDFHVSIVLVFKFRTAWGPKRSQKSNIDFLNHMKKHIWAEFVCFKPLTCVCFLNQSWPSGDVKILVALFCAVQLVWWLGGLVALTVSDLILTGITLNVKMDIKGQPWSPSSVSSRTT